MTSYPFLPIIHDKPVLNLKKSSSATKLGLSRAGGLRPGLSLLLPDMLSLKISCEKTLCSTHISYKEVRYKSNCHHKVLGITDNITKNENIVDYALRSQLITESKKID